MGLHVFPIPIPPPTHKLFCASASWHMLCYPLSPSRSAILYSTALLLLAPAQESLPQTGLFEPRLVEHLLHFFQCADHSYM